MLFEKLANVDMESSVFCSHFNKDILNEINILNFLMTNFLVYFTNPKINLEDQLISLARFSIALLIIYRRNKTKLITADLYNDLQSTVQDAFLAVKSFQSYDADLAVYLFQLGSDDLEKFFSCIRTVTQSKNCDYLELSTFKTKKPSKCKNK